MARYIGDKEVADFLIKEEGFLDKPTDIGDGKITLGSGLTDPKWHALYKKKGMWSKEDNRNAVLEEVAKRRVWAEDTIPNWEQLPESAQDALLSYKYNYNFTPTNSPNLFEAMRKGNFFKAAEEINATSKDPKFRKGLEERRKREQEMFLSDLIPQKTSNHSVYVPYTNNVVSDNTRVIRYPTIEEYSQIRTIVPEKNYVETTTISPGEQRAQQLRNTFESTRDYNRMMQNISIQNNPQPTFTPQYNYHSEGGSLNSKTWDNLSMAEKSEMMRVAIENGITTLPEIKEAYNEFAKGGYVPSKTIRDRITGYEGKAMTGAQDPVTGKWGKNNSFESEAARFYSALPDSIREQVLSNPELADNLYSYSYNVGAGNFKKRVVPALERYYAGEGSVKDIENSMWASNDAKLRGLQRRRAEEKEGVRNALLGEVMLSSPTEQEVPIFMPSNPQAFFAPLESYQRPVVVEEPLVQAAMENPYSLEQLEREERAQGLRNLGLVMSIMRGGQEQSYSPLWSAVSMLSGNQMAKGGKIHIKPSHRGRLTELKKRTGKTEAELYKNGSAATRKMITFARNARKWKHGLGGNLFSGEDTPTQQMNNGLNLYRRTNNLGETEYIYQETPDSEEILLTPTNKRFSDDPTNWDYKDANGREYSPKMVNPTNSSTLEASEKMGPLEKYVAELNWRAKNDPASIALQGKYTMPAIAAAPFLTWAGEAAYPYLSTVLANPYVDAGLTSAFAGHGLNHWINEGVNGWGDAAMTALEIVPLGRLARPVYSAGLELAEKYPALYQYPRYAAGKFKYGFDAELPTLYRKVKTLPKIKDGKVAVSNPNSRFAYENGYGEESPIITNFTTDAPVRSHSSGNWDKGLTLAFPGKTLLGKHVISTRPSDTFTFGDIISVPTKKVTAFTGRPKEISFLQNNGIETISSPEAEVFWESGASDLMSKIAQARATNAKIFSKKGSGIVLLKPKTPVGNFNNYASTVENLTRETFKSPTAKDYQFMDYVFKPLYKSETFPKVENFTMQFLSENPTFGEWMGNSERRRYLEQPWRWENLMYDPLTTAESEFRSDLNIGLKPEYKK